MKKVIIIIILALLVLTTGYFFTILNSKEAKIMSLENKNKLYQKEIRKAQREIERLYLAKDIIEEKLNNLYKENEGLEKEKRKLEKKFKKVKQIKDITKENCKKEYANLFKQYKLKLDYIDIQNSQIANLNLQVESLREEIRISDEIKLKMNKQLNYQSEIIKNKDVAIQTYKRLLKKEKLIGNYSKLFAGGLLLLTIILIIGR